MSWRTRLAVSLFHPSSRPWLKCLVLCFVFDILVIGGIYYALPNPAKLLKRVELERMSSDFKRFKFVAGPGNKKYVPLSQISRHLPRAVIVLEDSRFYLHRGFDLIEVFEAVTDSIQDGDRLRGASTISQQLVKNLYLSPTRSFSRKLIEALITIKLELNLTKGQILEIYLNSIDWGRGLLGVQDAAWHYFRKTPRTLTLQDCIFLAAIIPNPRRFGRVNDGLPTRFVRRQMIRALRNMFRQGYISLNEFQETVYRLNG